MKWADMTDDDPEPEPEPQITKHGIKVSYVPPHLRGPHKSSTQVNNKQKPQCPTAKSVAKN